MQWLYHVIGQVGIFLICAQTLIHFRPRESYEKYLKLLLSVMLLIQLLQPLLTVLGGDEIAGTDVQAAEFAEEIRTVLEQAAVQAEQTEDEDPAGRYSGGGGVSVERSHTGNEQFRHRYQKYIDLVDSTGDSVGIADSFCGSI